MSVQEEIVPPNVAKIGRNYRRLCINLIKGNLKNFLVEKKF